MSDPHTIRLPDDEWQNLGDEAESIGLSRSEYVRRILRTRDAAGAYSDQNTVENTPENTKEYEQRIRELEQRLDAVEDAVDITEPIDLEKAVKDLEWPEDWRRDDNTELAVVAAAEALRDEERMTIGELVEAAADEWPGIMDFSQSSRRRNIRVTLSRLKQVDSPGQGGRYYQWSDTE